MSLARSQDEREHGARSKSTARGLTDSSMLMSSRTGVRQATSLCDTDHRTALKNQEDLHRPICHRHGRARSYLLPEDAPGGDSFPGCCQTQRGGDPAPPETPSTLRGRRRSRKGAGRTRTRKPHSTVVKFLVQVLLDRTQQLRKVDDTS